MDNENIKNNDTLQLQQMIIFLKSELAKYQNEISTLKESDYYSLVLSLEQENIQLGNQNKELSLELMKMRKAFEKEMNDLHEDIQSRENQRIKQISSIETLVKNKNDLQTENRQLTKAIEEAQKELTASKRHWPEQIEDDYRKSVENIDNMLRDFIQKNDQQFSTINEELIKSRSETIDINRYLLKEIKSKNNKIDRLMSEIDVLKKQQQKIPPSSVDDKAVSNSDMLPHLDKQVQKMLTQSVNFEVQLDEKLRILDDLEHKLIQLANEIENK